MIPPIASRFVAGESVPAALEHTAELNDRGVCALLNFLGEHHEDPSVAAADATAYCDLVDDIAASTLDAAISVKPSQIGLDVSEDTFRDHYADIVEHAAAEDIFVWLDMEAHPTVDATLEAYCDHVTDYDGLGLCLQANLRRTRADLERLVDLPGVVRLVKGAYDPPADIAYASKQRVNRAYREDLAFLFEHDDRVAVGSHDPAMIELATDLHDAHGTAFEVQMLMGVREDAQTRLARHGYEVAQYVPFGDRWLSYFYRRIRERKENALFALRAIVSG